MGRALSRFAAWDIAALCVVELAITLTVLHRILDSQDTGMLLTESAARLARPFENLVGGVAVFAGLLTIVAGLLHPEIRLNRAQLLGAACLSGILAFPVVLLLSGLYIDGSLTARGAWLLRIIGIWLAIIAACRLLFSLIAQHTLPPRRVLMIGDPERIARLGVRLHGRLGRRFEPMFAVPPGAPAAPSAGGFSATDILPLAQIKRQRVWGIVLAAAGEHPLSVELLDYKLRGMKILSEQSFHEQHLGRIDLESLTVNDLLFGSGYANDTLSGMMKRFSDIVVSIAMLLATLPLMVITAAAIKFDTPGPIFYRQQRIGHFGRPFTLFKFRSMSVDAEASGAPMWAQKQDPRITKVGAFIRTTRIDELPQLANVLLGQMSLVGPRPERPHFVEQLSQSIPFYRERNYVKPGVTGWAQVNFPYGASVEDAREKLAYDLYYVKHRGLLLDLNILLATVRVVIFREGAR